MAQTSLFVFAAMTVLLSLVYEVGGQALYGVAYSPYRVYGHCPSKEEMMQDHHIYASHTNRIRLYSTECSELNDLAMEVATSSTYELLLGVWIDGDPNRNNQEMEDLYAMLRKFPNAKLIGISVGNEVLYRGTLSPEVLAQLVSQVKATVRQIGAETGSFTLQNVPVFSVDVIPHPYVVSVSDAVGVNIHPFYRTDLPTVQDPYEMSEMALGSSIEQITSFRDLYVGKEVFVTETGWPTQSAPHEHHRGSLDVQKLYREKFTGWADSIGQKYFWFELVDSPWKKEQFPYEPESMSEFHWGIYTWTRSHK